MKWLLYNSSSQGKYVFKDQVWIKTYDPLKSGNGHEGPDSSRGQFVLRGESKHVNRNHLGQD